MALNIGSKLGHYDVTALIGEGGMGQVWQATDTQLNRQVALKILSDAFAADPDRLARFKREAQILASLNHPNIAAIYGIEEAEGTRALVLELVEGPTLADRISKGPIPLDEALPIAKQIAEALEAAHEAGVIHRDLKPANIKVREDGTVKVLDFGLAKALAPNPEADPSQSPTLTAAATQMGVIIGTAAYMSPEQASGETAEKRSDIWSFGVLLFEMLTGQQLFTGKTVSHVLAKVLERDLDFTVLPASTPAPIRRLLRRCLEREQKRRLRDVGEALSHLEEAATRPEATLPTPAPISSTSRPPLGWLAAAAVAAALATGVAVWTLKPAPPQPVSRLSVSAPPSAPVVPSFSNNDVAVSPDGSFVVYRSDQGPGGEAQLFVRMTHQIEAAPLRGPTNPFGPFVSPDGAWVGFMTGPRGDLQKVSVLGGPPVTISELPAPLRGASWGVDDVIIFGTASGSGLMRVSGAGGEPEAITTSEGPRHVWPDILPGGAAVLFTIDRAPGPGQEDIALLNLDTGEHDVIIPGGTHPKYSATGHIVYGVEGTLRAVAFNLNSLEVTSDPVPVVEGVAIKGSGAGSFDISPSGSLVYVAGAPAGAGTNTLVWVDRDGREEPIESAPAGAFFWARVSPDGTRIAYHTIEEDNTDVWVSDLTRPGTRIKVTTDTAADGFPLWTPDGEAVVFQSFREGEPRLFQKAADGTGVAEQLLALEGTTFLFPYEWSPDGEMLLVATNMPATGNDFGVLSMEGEPSWQPLVQTEAREGNPAISPDGQWVAYRSHETGESEVYVAQFPTLEGRQAVSVGGGWSPVWSRDGRELFYQAQGRLMVVPITTEPTFTLGTPEILFEGPYVSSLARSYDLAPDGRFLMVRRGDIETSDTDALTHVVLVQNWFEELNQLVPTN